MISRTGLHAIRALATLSRAQEDEFVGAGPLSRSIGAPPNYLGKLMQSLATAGFLESRKGLHGGFRLAQPSHSIRLFDVLEPIDHASRWEGCFLGQSVCSDDTACAVHQKWARLRDQYLAFLRETTIADIADSVPKDRFGIRDVGFP
jgi:Rrf2 family protein